MSTDVQTGIISTDIPARLDRLPWSRFHWMIVIGLGTVWILDGLEVTIVGSMSEALKSTDTGLGLTSAQIGLAGAVYVAGACVGALFFGQLADRFGRKKLFLITLGLYTVATVLTAFSMNPTWYLVCRFFTGSGIGGEYAAINSAIDELIPKLYRGRIDVVINGSYWLGAAGGALLTLPLLDPTLVNPEIGWRLAFGLGGILAIMILVVRRHVPESPRWLFIHGRDEEAEKIVAGIERRVAEEDHVELEPVQDTITIRQRRAIGMGEIATTVFTLYPRRTVLCFSLFVGQAFLYNAFFFTYGDTLTTFLGVERTGGYIAIFAISNFIGALLLSRLFDTARSSQDDRRDLSALRDPAGDHRVPAGWVVGRDAHAGRLHRVLLRLGRGQLRLPDRQRDLPDGDPRPVHRLLLRDRDRRRRHHRTAAVRHLDRQRCRSPVTSPGSLPATSSGPP